MHEKERSIVMNDNETQSELEPEIQLTDSGEQEEKMNYSTRQMEDEPSNYNQEIKVEKIDIQKKQPEEVQSMDTMEQVLGNQKDEMLRNTYRSQVPPTNQYQFWQQQSGGMNGGYYNGQQTFPNAGMQGEMPKPYVPPKKNSGIAKKLGTGALVGIFAAAGFCGVIFGANKLGIIESQPNVAVSNTIGSNGTIATTVVSKGAVTAPSDLSSVVDKCMPSIVSINSTITTTVPSFWGDYSQDSTGSGSGIILKISDDEILIVTNNHVIQDAKKIVVGFDGTTSNDDMIEATVKGTDSTNDLAVVLVKTKDVPKKTLNHICAIEMGSSDDVRVGQMSIAIGNALGYGQSMTVGYISAKDREVQVSEDSSNTMTLLQTDAAINPGNSGGALLNVDGQLIGINSAKYSDTSVEGMGFAIPISRAISIINDLMEREVLAENEKGYLGVSGISITKEDQQKYPNMPIGIYVSKVSEDGAAYAAGIVSGDIIVGVEGEEILTIEALAEKVNSYRIGKTITIQLKRYKKGKYVDQDVKVTLKSRDTLKSLDGDNKNSGKDNNSNNNQDNNNNDSQSQQQDQGNDSNGFDYDYDPWSEFFGN